MDSLVMLNIHPENEFRYLFKIFGIETGISGIKISSADFLVIFVTFYIQEL